MNAVTTAHETYTIAYNFSRDILAHKAEWTAKNWARVARLCAIANDKLRAEVGTDNFTRMEIGFLNRVNDLSWDARAQVEGCANPPKGT